MSPDLSLVGHIVTADRDIPRGEILITDGIITDVLTAPSASSGCERIDAGDALLLPGVIDPHVHSLSYRGEGVEAATRSAAAGGVTTILEMPFDADGPIWSLGAFHAKVDMVEREAHVDVGLFATVKPGGQGIADVAPLAAAGALCFKVSTYHTDPDRFPRTPDHELVQVFNEISKTGRRVCVHAENDEMVRTKVEELRHGPTTDPLLHCRSRPPVTETSAVANVIELAVDTRVKLHLCHISVPRSVDLVWEGIASGVDVTVETCPHYLIFTETDLQQRGAWLKCNPPLRSRKAVDGLWDQLRRDRIHAIASDHAPWPEELKTKPTIFENASGGPGVETLLSTLATDALGNQQLTIQQLVNVTSTRVAEAFSIDHRKGDLKEGLDADVIIFDPNKEWDVDGKQLHSNARWSPFDGLTVRGRVMKTISRGAVIWDGENVTSTAGRGEIVKARA